MLFQKNNISFFVLFLTCMCVLGCASKSEGYAYNKMKNSSNMHRATMRPYVVNGKRYYPTRVSIGDRFSGMASWYGDDFHGKNTSNGETYNMYALTAAHKILPMNTMVRVTNLLNNRSLIVRINDRGPFVKSRIIDLSYTAAKKLGVARRGTAPVRLQIVGFNGRINSRLRTTSSTTTASRKSPSMPQSIDVSNFLVQIGAFRNLSGAKTYGKRLQRRYLPRYSAFIKRSFWKGGYIYRVYLKGYRSAEEASDFIKSQNLDGAFIVRGN